MSSQHAMSPRRAMSQDHYPKQPSSTSTFYQQPSSTLEGERFASYGSENSSDVNYSNVSSIAAHGKRFV